MIHTSLVLPILISLLAFFLYGKLIFQIKNHWLSLDQDINILDNQELPFVSILVAARNEAENIQACINALLAQSYHSNKFEIIVIDDFSTDKTAKIVRTNKHDNLRLLQMRSISDNEQESSKKKAIAYGVEQSKGDYILITDADCLPEVYWLKTMINKHISTQSDFTAGPVLLTGKGYLETFQILDYIGMMAVTAFGIGSKKFYLANGANMLFNKKSFEAVDGYAGNNQFASGDDVFLINKIAKSKSAKISFLKHKYSIVKTSAVASFAGLLKQRIRWATKNKAQASSIMFGIMLLVFFCNLAILSWILISLFIPIAAYIALILLCLKMWIDRDMLAAVAKDFKFRLRLDSFLVASITTLFYIPLLGVLGQFIKKYNWKGRKVR